MSWDYVGFELKGTNMGKVLWSDGPGLEAEPVPQHLYGPQLCAQPLRVPHSSLYNGLRMMAAFTGARTENELLPRACHGELRILSQEQS